MRERIPNALFFAAGGPPPVAAVPEHVFYAGRERPPPEVPIATRTAAPALRFALVLFLVGWSGILFQASFLQQVVFGAPVFEELAKFGLALLVVAGLRIRSLAIRLPLAWLSGAAFGVMEHYVTYATEDVLSYAERVMFHAASPGLSMLLYGAFEDLPDVRARWAATVPATLVHWANNFSAVVLGVTSLVVGFPDIVALVWSGLLTAALLAVTLGALLAHDGFVAYSRETLFHAMPRLGITDTRPLSA